MRKVAIASVVVLVLFVGSPAFRPVAAACGGTTQPTGCKTVTSAQAPSVVDSVIDWLAALFG